MEVMEEDNQQRTGIIEYVSILVCIWCKYSGGTILK